MCLGARGRRKHPQLPPPGCEPGKEPSHCPDSRGDCVSLTHPRRGQEIRGPSLELFCLPENRKATTSRRKVYIRQLSPLNQKPTTGLARIAATVLSKQRRSLAAQTRGQMDRQQLRSGWRWRLLLCFQSWVN